MKVSPYEIEWPEPYAIATDGKDQSRSEGLHLSTVIRHVSLKMGWAKDYSSTGKPSNKFPMHVGIAWENYLFQLIASRMPEGHEFDPHPGELCEDGIYMSPDGIEIDSAGQVIIHEIKCTWKKPNKVIESRWEWLTQVKSYCRAAGSTCGVLHQLYITGDPFTSLPSHISTRMEFTKRELEESWEMILREAQSLR